MDSSTSGSQLKNSITEAARKIESIIDAAQQAAEDIRAQARADAQREAQRVLDESSSQLSAVAAPLIQRVENLLAEAVALTHEIEAAAARLRELEGHVAEASALAQEPASITAAPDPEPAPDGAPAPAPPGPKPMAYPGTGASAPSEAPEAALLRATQMAVSGSPRHEIEAALRDEFGIADASPVVDDILGQAS